MCLRILAGTDFSSEGDQAVQRAIEIARARGAELHIVHVLPASSGFAFDLLGIAPGRAERGRSQAAFELEKCASRARDAGVTTRTSVLDGGTDAALSAEAGRIGADLLVIGFSGERSFPEIAVGTTLEGLLGHLPCDVLVVKTDSGAPYDRPVACVDFERGTERLVTRVADLAGGRGVHLIHPYETPHERVLVRAGVEVESIQRHADRARHEVVDRMKGLVAQLDEVAIAGTSAVVGPARFVIPAWVERLNGDLVGIAHHRSLIAVVLLLGAMKRVIARVSADVLLVDIHA